MNRIEFGGVRKPAFRGCAVIQISANPPTPKVFSNPRRRASSYERVNNNVEFDPLEVAGVATEMGVRVYTIGVGTHGMAPYPVEDGRGGMILRRIPVEIDEEMLTRIAEETGGVYQRAGTTDSLRRIYTEIDRLERTEVEGTTYRRWRELYAWPLLAGAVCWILSLLLEATVLGRIG